MEKVYMPSAEPTPIPVSTNKLTEERGIQVSVEDLNQSEQIDWQDRLDTMSVSTTQLGESGNEDWSRSSTPIQEEAFDDRLTIASSVSSRIQKRKTIKIPKDRIVQMSGAIQESNDNNQQFSANSSTTKKIDKQIPKSQRDQHYPKKRVNQISARHEGDPLMSSTPVSSEDEDNPPKLPEKNDTKTKTNSCNKIKSTAV